MGFSKGDPVKIKGLPVFLAKHLQEGHGGWAEGMENGLGKEGTVDWTKEGPSRVKVAVRGQPAFVWNQALVEGLSRRGSRSPPRPFKVGDKVCLASGYEGVFDAAKGPLTMGNWGIVEQDDGDETKAFKVVAKSGDRVGREWWYDAKALKALAPRKFKVGDKVSLASGYDSVMDARKGPLQMGDMGVVEEDDGAEVKAFKVQAKTGAKKGSVWWYDAGALKVAERMFKVGDKVGLLSGYEGVFDAGKGPLKMGDWGIIETDDGDDEKSFKVRVKSGEKIGSTWWYDGRALKSYSGSETKSSPKFAKGDKVKIRGVPVAVAKAMQEGYGGWVDSMAGGLGKEGVAEWVKVDPLRLKVKVAGQSAYVWNPALIELMSGSGGGRRFKVGQQVRINPGYTGGYKLENGPLKAEDWGIVREDDGKDSQPFKIEAMSGEKKGATWWYATEALRAYERPFKVGDKVCAAPGYEAVQDAGKGPLSRINWGIVEKDDGATTKAFKVVAKRGNKAGSQWWYDEKALEKFTGTEGETKQKFSKGDRVKVKPMLIERAKSLQEGFGGWADGMEKSLGKEGTVISTKDNPIQVEVNVNGSAFHWNQDLIKAVARGGGGRRFKVGQKVRINPDYTGGYKLENGPLRAKDWGIVREDDGKDSQPFKIEAMSGEKKGATWWYAAEALKASDEGPRPFNVGDKVCLVSGYEGILDAGKGPLKAGDWGVVEEDDGDEEKAFKVKARTGEKSGTLWWYDAKALKVYGGSDKEGAFSEGDQVKIKEVSPELAKVMQGSHGGWVRAMEGCLGKAGVVEEVKLGPLRVKVKVTGQSSYVWNPTLLEQAPRQFVVGQQVCLAAGFESVYDAGKGPLEKDGWGVVLEDDGEDVKPFKVEAKSGSKKGGTWWYHGAALKKYDDASAIRSDFLERLRVLLREDKPKFALGHKVCVAPGYESCRNAGKGPLKRGNFGVVVKIDKGDAQPYRVEAKSGEKIGSMWWYESDALQEYDGGAVSEKTNVSVGDRVKIASVSIARAKEMQKGFGGWVNEMGKCLGKEGRLVTVGDKKAQVKLGDETFVWNLALVEPVGKKEREFLVGQKVSLASGYEGIFDAAKGPLKKCDWGIVEEDDGDETKAFKVKAKSGEKAGSTWWYDAKALQEYVEQKFSAGDQVRIKSVSVAVGKEMQKDFGGWADKMGQCLGKTGKIVRVYGSQLKVAINGLTPYSWNPALVELVQKWQRFKIGQRICLNPDYDGAYDLKDGALQSGDWGVVVEDDGKESQPFRIEVKSGKKKGATWWYDAMGLMSYGGPVEEEKSKFSAGDKVKIKGVSIAVGKTMQDGYGGWAEKMAGCLGKEGIVELVKLDPIRVRVKVGDTSFIWNEEMIELISRGSGGGSGSAVKLRAGQWVCLAPGSLGLEGPLGEGDWGVVQEYDGKSSQPYRVEAKSGKKKGATWWYGVDALKVYDGPVEVEKSTFSTGDRVKIKAVSIAAAKTMQDGCGGWAEKMAGCLGKEGIVELVKLDPFRVRVKIGTSSFVWNPNMVEIVERLKVGQRVCISSTYAGSGPLKRGEWGVIVEDNGADCQPFQVEVKKGAKRGATWWYDPMALQVYDGPIEEEPLLVKCSFEGDSIRLPLTKDTTLIEFLAWVEKKWGVGKGIEYLTDRKWMKMEKNDELRKMYEQANLGKEVHFQIYSEGATRGENDHALSATTPTQEAKPNKTKPQMPITELIENLEKIGDQIFALKSELVTLTVDDEKSKKNMEVMLKKLMERCRNGENVSKELEMVKQVREAREQKRKKLETELERKSEREKLLMAVIEKRLREKELEGDKELERQQMIAQKVLQIAKMDNRVRYEINLDPSEPSFHSPFPVSFAMTHSCGSFLPAYQGDNLFSISPEALRSFDNYVSFGGRRGVVGSIRPGPFAKGAFRYAFFGMIQNGLVVGGKKEVAGERVVLKHMIDVYEKEEMEEEISELRECAVVHMLGRRVVEEFKKRGVKGCEVEMVKCEVLEWSNPTLEGPLRQFWTAEPCLPGKFLKFNNNDGTAQNLDYPLAQALSHFSCYLFNGNLIMLDIQGCARSENNLVLTDPAFSTPHGKGFGGGNMKAAMSTFFKEHKCNWICHTLMGEGAKKNLLQP